MNEIELLLLIAVALLGVICCGVDGIAASMQSPGDYYRSRSRREIEAEMEAYRAGAKRDREAMEQWRRDHE